MLIQGIERPRSIELTVNKACGCLAKIWPERLIHGNVVPNGPSSDGSWALNGIRPRNDGTGATII